MKLIGFIFFGMSFLSAALGHSQTLSMVIDRGSSAFASPRSESRFVEFLKTRRDVLLQNSPNLVFPAQIQTGAEMMAALDSKTPGFVNREHHCRFLKKLALSLDRVTERQELLRLTSNGQLCVASDLPEVQQTAWALSMHRFLWESHWLTYRNQRLNAERYVATVLGGMDLPKVEIKSWTSAGDIVKCCV